MPELPEVETIRRELAPRVIGRTLGETWAFPHPKFVGALDAAGGTVRGVARRGKYLLFGLDGPDRPELIIHLGMTGALLLLRSASIEGHDAYVRAWWALDDGHHLVFRDVRRFGRVTFARAGRYTGTLAVQGPDALDPSLDGERLWRALAKSSRAIKTRLLSQRPLAGVGNIYADEALWLAGIHPRARRLSRPRAEKLLVAVRDVLEAGLDNGGTTLRDYRTLSGGTGENQHRLVCYGRGGQPCLRCGRQLRRIVLDGRSTTYCPACQT